MSSRQEFAALLAIAYAFCRLRAVSCSSVSDMRSYAIWCGVYIEHSQKRALPKATHLHRALLSANVVTRRANITLRLKAPTTTGGHGSQAGNLAAPGLRRLRRQARVVTTLCNMFRDARTCRQAHVAANADVVGNRALPAHRTVVAELRRAGERSVRAQQAAATNVNVVPDLHLVVDLGVRAYDCVTPAAPVDARTGTNLNVVTEEHPQQLRPLMHVAGLVHPKAKAVGPDAHTAVKQAVCAYPAVLQCDVCVQPRPGAHMHARADHTALAYLAERAHVRALVHDCSLTEPRAWVHVGARMDERAQRAPAARHRGPANRVVYFTLVPQRKQEDTGTSASHCGEPRCASSI